MVFGRADYTVDGKRFAVIDLLSNKAVLWWQGNPTTERTGIQAAAWSPDGSTLAVRTAGDGSAIQVLDPRTTSELKSVRSVPGPSWLKFSADGRVLAGGAGDGMAFWDAKTGRELGRIDTRHAVALGALFDPSGTYIAVMSLKVVKVWRVPEGVRAGPPRPHDEIPPPRPVPK